MGFRLRFVRSAVLLAAAALLASGCRSRELDKGYACLALGDYPLAIRFLSALVEKGPEDFQARLGLGKALLQKAVAEGDSAAFAQALMQFEACRTLGATADLNGLLADAYTENARIRLGRRDTAGALGAVAKAMERDPSGTRPLNLAGIIYGKLGDAGKAQALFERALRLDSADASAHFNAGMLDWQAGRFPQAHEHWMKALRAMPQDEDVLYWYALAEKKARGEP
jgi:tetratricopeptide (TPR) repeat protein